MIQVNCKDPECDWGPKTFYTTVLARERRMIHMHETGHKTYIEQEAS